MKKAYSSNIMTECHYYMEKNLYAILNNTNTKQDTDFYDINGDITKLTLHPTEIRWLKK